MSSRPVLNRIHLGLLATIVIPIMAFANEPQPEGQTTLRILSYNIKHGYGMDGKVDLSRSARLIKKLNPDLVALQEIDKLTERTRKVDQTAELGRMTEMHAEFGPFFDFQGGEYGMAILSKNKPSRVQNHRLPDGQEPRTALAITIAPIKGGPEIVFAGIHFYATQEERLAQAKHLLEILKTETRPVIFAGDYNSRPDSDVMKLFADEWTIPDKGKDNLTIPSDKPRSEIDFIMFRNFDGWKVDKIDVLEEPLVSDHRPVLLELSKIVQPKSDSVEQSSPDSHESREASDVSAAGNLCFSFDGGTAPSRGSANVSVSGNPEFVKGLNGPAIRIPTQPQPGATFLQCTVDEPQLSAERDFSLQFWVRTTMNSESKGVLLTTKNYPDNSLHSQKQPGWVFYVSNGTWAWNVGSGKRRVTYERSNGQYMPINDGRWHQLAMTHSADEDLVRLYFDGKNMVTYHLGDASSLAFGNDNPLTVGWDGQKETREPDELPVFTRGAQQLQELVDAFNGYGMAPLEPNEFKGLVNNHTRLFEAKLEQLKQDESQESEELVATLAQADLKPIRKLTQRLMGSPYTVHQRGRYDEVALWHKLYRLEEGKVLINAPVAERLAKREVLNPLAFDMDELELWDRVLTPEEVLGSYTGHFQAAPVEQAASHQPLVAGAWNIFHGGLHSSVEVDGWDSREAIIEILRRERIDVLMMQETYSSGDYIAAELGFYFATTSDFDNMHQGSNISVLSRYPIKDVYVPPKSTFNSVGARVAVRETQDLMVISNWFGMRNFEDVYSFHQERFAASDEIPVLFGGDFNAVPHTDGGDSPASQKLLSTGFVDAYRSLYPDIESFPGHTHDSGSRIDQLYFKGSDLKLVSTDILSTWPSRFPADHFLIKSIFEISN